MAKEPELVLIEQCVATLRRVKDVCVNQTVHGEKTTGKHYRGHRENNHERGDELRPHKQRQPVKRHARSAHFENSPNNDDGAYEAGDLYKGDDLRPDIHALSRRVAWAGEWYVAKPTGVGSR